MGLNNFTGNVVAREYCPTDTISKQQVKGIYISLWLVENNLLVTCRYPRTHDGGPLGWGQDPLGQANSPVRGQPDGLPINHVARLAHKPL